MCPPQSLPLPRALPLPLLFVPLPLLVIGQLSQLNLRLLPLPLLSKLRAGGSQTKRREAGVTTGYRHVAGESASVYVNGLSLAW